MKKIIPENVLKLISEDKISEAFSIILQNCHGEIRRNAISIKQRFNSLNNEFNKGLIDYSQKQILMNQIVQSLIDLVERERSDFDLKSPISTDSIEIEKDEGKKINIYFAHYRSETLYNVKTSSNTKGEKLLTKIKELVKKNHPKTLQAEKGITLELGLFNETKEKRLILGKSLKNNGVEEHDVLVMSIRNKKHKLNERT